MKKITLYSAFRCGISLLLGVTLLAGCKADVAPPGSDSSVQSAAPAPEAEVKTVYVSDSMPIPEPFATYTGTGDMLITFDAPCKPNIIRFEADSDLASITGYKDDDSSEAWVKGANKGETFKDIISYTYTSCKVSCEGSWTLELYDNLKPALSKGEKITLSGTRLVSVESIYYGTSVTGVKVDYEGDGFCAIWGLEYNTPFSGTGYSIPGYIDDDLLLFTKQTTYSGAVSLSSSIDADHYAYLLVQCAGECTLTGL